MNILKHLNIALLAGISLMFASCADDDEKKGAMLAGEWEGDFGSCYDYQCDICDKVHTCYAYNSNLIFFPSRGLYSDHGDGYQFDYYREGPMKRDWFYFKWEFNNGILEISYEYDDLFVQVFDYNIDERINVFTGRFHEESLRKFFLNKVADLAYDEVTGRGYVLDIEVRMKTEYNNSNWHTYYDNYDDDDYYDDRDWNHHNIKSAPLIEETEEEQVDSVEQYIPKGKIIRRWNRNL